MADLLCENMMNMGHFTPPKIHRTQSAGKQGMSIATLAEIMLEANENTLFDGLDIEFARKTKGGIAIVDRNTSNEKQIITGSGQEAWPYFADTNPHRMTQQAHGAIFAWDDFCVRRLSPCSGLSDADTERAQFILDRIHRYDSDTVTPSSIQ